MYLDFPKIWEHVTREFQCGADSIHGPAHWRRVEENGLCIAVHSGAVVEVVRLFAVFHDSRRESDWSDECHGERAADYVASLQCVLFELSDEQLDLLEYACAWHAHGRTSEDATIGTCWDADRLDLGRCDIQPDASLMSTAFGRLLVTSSGKL